MWHAILMTPLRGTYAQDEWAGETPVDVAALAGALEAAAAGNAVRQLAGTRSASPATTLQLQLIGAALWSVEFSEGVNSSIGSGVAPVFRVVRLMLPSAAIATCATYWLAATAGV